MKRGGRGEGEKFVRSSPLNTFQLRNRSGLRPRSPEPGTWRHHSGQRSAPLLFLPKFIQSPHWLSSCAACDARFL